MGGWVSGWVGGWGRGGWWDDSKHVYALLLPYLSQCCLFCSQAFSCACCLGVRAADKQVHTPVVPKYWQKMWTPPRQRRLSAAIAFASVVQVFDKKVSPSIGDALQVPHSGTVDNMWKVEYLYRLSPCWHPVFEQKVGASRKFKAEKRPALSLHVNECWHSR